MSPIAPLGDVLFLLKLLSTFIMTPLIKPGSTLNLSAALPIMPSIPFTYKTHANLSFLYGTFNLRSR